MVTLRQKRQSILVVAVYLLGAAIESRAFVPHARPTFAATSSSTILVRRAEATTSSTAATSFILTELRQAAMRLHTREQSPKEGQVDSPAPKQYTPTHADYLAFLVDSQHVYQAMEEIVNQREELCAFRNTGLERTQALEQDISFMVSEFGLERPAVGPPGRDYAEALRNVDSIPEFMCHYYNHYFAHTAGGRMIGKQMSSLLLNKKTLEFYKVCVIGCCRINLDILFLYLDQRNCFQADPSYCSFQLYFQWDGDLNQIKTSVKDNIEAAAAMWNDEQKMECVDATAAAFQGGGGINGYLSGRV